jgi:hypothetical protein
VGVVVGGVLVRWGPPPHARDANAAANLQHIAASSAVTARGEDSAGRDVRVPVNLASTKREPGGKPAHATA